MKQLALLGAPAEPAQQTEAPASPPPPPKPEIERWAEMSLDLRYRWLLGRRWSPGAKGALDLWCCLNPSDANGQRDDPSCLRMMAFSQHWGSVGILVVNLAALVSSSPEALSIEDNPIGRLCDKFIVEAAEQALKSGGRIIAAWGGSVRFDEKGPSSLWGRDAAVLRRLTALADVYCIGRNANGSPRHPHARGRHKVPITTPLEVFASRSPS